MERKDIANFLNSELMVNAIGSTVTVAEDLSNMVDYGKTVAQAQKSDFLDFYGQFVAGVIEYDFGLRTYEPTSLGIYKTVTDFIGVKERIKNKALLQAVDSPVGNLENGKSYIDGKYHANQYDNKIFTKWDTYRIIYSIDDTDSQMKQRFATAEGVVGLVALINANFRNTLNANRHETEKRVLLGGIVNAYNDGRYVDLRTMYNTEKGTSLTVKDCLTNDDFQAYALNVMADVKNAMTEGLNEIYNDGTVLTFTPASELKTVMLSSFANACKFNAKANTYNETFVNMGSYEEVPFWQNRGKSLAPRLGTSGCTIGDIKETDGATDDPTITEIKNVIATVYDSDALSYCSKVLAPVIEPVYGGRFNNYIHDEEIEMLVDPRSSMVVFTLGEDE